jgi:predicted SAM-dependent methyltransferase
MSDENLFESNSFDGIIAFYSVFHLPRNQHLKVFQNVFNWLRSDGVFVVTLGSTDCEEYFAENWLGAKMFWSHFDKKINLDLIGDAGFKTECVEERVNLEDGITITFQWIIARKSITV